MTNSKKIPDDLFVKDVENEGVRRSNSPGQTKDKEKSLKYFIRHFIGSTLARSNLILCGSLGAFIGTLTLYFLSINKGVLIDGDTVLLFTLSGIIAGASLDLLLSLYSFLKKK